MKNFVVFIFAIVIMAGCVENHYFYCLEYDENGKCKDWAEMDTDPRVDNETPDNNQKDADSEKNDFEDEDVFVEENPDEDVFVDYCVSVVDIYGEDIAGEYKDNLDESNETTVSIALISLQKEKTCQIVFTSYYYPILEEISLQTTTLPLKRFPIKYNEDECYLFLEFLDIYNILYIRIVRISDQKDLLDKKFSRKWLFLPGYARVFNFKKPSYF